MHLRKMAGLVAAMALSVGIVVPASASSVTGVHHWTPQDVAQLSYEIETLDAHESHHKPLNTTSLNSWFSNQGWDAANTLWWSNDPQVLSLLDKRAKELNTTRAAVRGQLDQMMSAAPITHVNFVVDTLKVWKDGVKAPNNYYQSLYLLRKRISVAGAELYFFETPIGSRSGNYRYLILTTPGPDTSPSGKTMSRHVHFLLAKNKTDILPAIVKNSMPTIIEKNATHAAKLEFLRLSLTFVK